MAAQRLRKTFKYPTESDDEDTVEAGMDAQDQETLISTLSAHDTSATHTYTLLLLVLPLAPILFYIPRLFSLSTLLPTLLAITSLLASAYTLYFLPLPPQEVDLVETPAPRNAPGRPIRKPAPWEKEAQKPVRRPVPYVSEEVAEVLATHIVTANRALGGALALYEYWQGREWSEGLGVGGGYLPLLVCVVVLWARTELRIIDMDALVKLKAQQGGVGKTS